VTKIVLENHLPLTQTKKGNMTPEANRILDSVDTITDDTRALISAAAEVAEEKVGEARNRLASAMAAAKDTCAALQQKAVESAKATDKVIRANPYQAVGIAFGVGALVGFLLSRRDT
jgi:ElaB/YqjD/DUF883 family membrane-anchored ribosome-binding protein